MDDNKSRLIEDFTNITGVENGRAQFYLETALWNLELALSTFYEDPIEMDDHGEMEEEELEPLNSPPPVAKPSTPPPNKDFNIKSAKQLTNIRTLGEMVNDKSSSDEEGQAFYAGGSERSGQQILGPKKKIDGTNMVADLFKNAKEHGAEVIDKIGAKASNSKSIFQGKAYKLGDKGELQSAPIEISEGEEEQEFEVALKFWQNGFSIDDGPLREFDDPANKEILEDIKKGQLPKELLQKYRNKMVNVNLEDHSNQPYIKPKKTTISFAGTGHRLGNPTDPITTSKTQSTISVNSTISEESLKATALSALDFDPTQPIVSFQIRLLDGSRITVKLNEVHTIAHIRTYIQIILPDYENMNYIFMTTFPSKELLDESIDLKAAQLNNNQIVIKLK